MTLSELFKVQNALLFAYANAKCDYEISVKDYGEDDFVTLMAKQDMDRLDNAKKILEKEHKEIASKCSKEEVDRVLEEVMI